MRIQHNIMAMSAYRNYTNNVSAMKKNLEKLSSGYKINRAGDDAAGLAISEKMRAQITGLETAQKNAKDGISLVQTAEGALTEVHDMLNRMVELATQSANGTYDNTTDRNQMQKEVDQLLSEIDRIADSSNFNGINLLDGTLGLNTEAFTVTGTVNGVDAVAAATAAAALGTIHGGASATFQAPSFSVNLKDLKVSASASGTIKLKVGNATLTSGKLTTTAATVGAATVASKIAANYTGTGAGKFVTIGGVNFKVTDGGGGVLNFTAIKDAGQAGAATATEISSTAAKTFNDTIKGAKVEVVDNGGTKKVDDTQYDHAIESLELAQAEKAGGLFGADLDMSKVVVNGGQLKIGSNATYTFKMSAADSSITAGGTVTIDTRKFTTASEQVAEAIRLLSSEQGIGPGVNISAKDATHIHVDMASAAAQTAKASTEDKFKALFKVVTPEQNAKGAGVKLAITDGKIADGNVLTVGGKKIELKATDTIDTIKTKIEGLGLGYTVEKNDVAKDKDGNVIAGAKELVIRAKTTDADGKTIEAKNSVAPTVLGKGLTLQIGDTADSFNQLNVLVQDMHSGSLGIGGLKIDTEEAAQAATDKIKAAINRVSDVRGTLGATQNRLDHTINNLGVMTENIQDAESTIRDVDVAEEMMAYTKNNILIQSAQAMLAQANQVPQGVLQLLG